ncbi:MAG: serine hydrolase domain-containing protein [Gemmataceae bacterium]
MNRLALCLLPLLVSLCAAQAPTTGTANPAFDDLEVEVKAYMRLARCQAAAVAVSRDGRLLLSRGYGWRDRDKREPTPVDALFRLGSVTKPITAAVVKELVRDGRLRLDSKLLDVLFTGEARGKLNGRLSRVTIGHLLAHQGGWDARRSFDPVFNDLQAQKDLRLGRPATPDDIVRWFLPRPLDFDPGSRTVYSNFGYCLLGRVVEKVTARKFEEATTELVLKPWKIEDIRAARTLPRHRHEREVWYPVQDAMFSLEVMDSCAGLVASAPAMCEFLHRYWLSGDRRETGSKGEFVFVGSLQGTTAVVMQRPSGANVVALFNNRRNDDPEGDQKALVKRLGPAVDLAVKD